MERLVAPVAQDEEKLLQLPGSQAGLLVWVAEAMDLERVLLSGASAYLASRPDCTPDTACLFRVRQQEPGH